MADNVNVDLILEKTFDANTYAGDCCSQGSVVWGGHVLMGFVSTILYVLTSFAARDLYKALYL